jgi:hypothetical protein
MLAFMRSACFHLQGKMTIQMFLLIQDRSVGIALFDLWTCAVCTALKMETVSIPEMLTVQPTCTWCHLPTIESTLSILMFLFHLCIINVFHLTTLTMLGERQTYKLPVRTVRK